VPCPKVCCSAIYDFNISGAAEEQTWDKVRSQLERVEAVDEQCNHCNALPISDHQENCGGVGGGRAGWIEMVPESLVASHWQLVCAVDAVSS
jgi:hypothetical protein